MKKFLASATFIFAFAVYTVYQYTGNAAAVSYTAPTSAQTEPQTIAISAPNSAPPQTTAVSTQTPTPSQTTPASQAPAAQPSQPASTPSSQSAQQTQLTQPAPAPKPKGQYVDGSYTGSTANAYYGYVQVQVTISGGKVADVTFLQYPNDRSTSRYINSQAMPLLKQEAIQAQSASVSGVSGASETSMAFRESLATALTKAKS